MPLPGVKHRDLVDVVHPRVPETGLGRRQQITEQPKSRHGEISLKSKCLARTYQKTSHTL